MGANGHLPDEFMRTGSTTVDVRESEKEKHGVKVQRIGCCGKSASPTSGRETNT